MLLPDSFKPAFDCFCSFTHGLGSGFMTGLEYSQQNQLYQNIESHSLKNDKNKTEDNRLISLAFTRSVLFNSVCNQAESVGRLAKLNLSFRAIKYASWILPFAVALIHEQNIENKSIRKVVDLTHKHLGKLAFLVSVVSSIGLIILGQPIQGATTLALLSIELGKAHLPKNTTWFLAKSYFILFTTANLILNRTFTKMYCTILIVNKISRIYFKNAQVKQRQTHANKSASNSIKVINSDFLTKKQKYCLNEKWSNINPLNLKQTIQTTDFDSLKTFLSSFDWNSNFPETEDREKCIEDLKTEVNQLIQQISTENIPSLSFQPQVNYYLIKNYFAYICQELPNQNTDIQLQILFRLAKAGRGAYGDEIIQEMQAVCNQLIIHSSTSSLPNKLLAFLQNERNRISKKIYEQKIVPSGTSSPILNYNIWLRACHVQEQFNLSNECSITYESLFDKYVSDYINRQMGTITPSLNKFFINKYLNSILSLEESNLVISDSELSKYWKDWIAKQNDLSVKHREKLSAAFDLTLSEQEVQLKIGDDFFIENYTHLASAMMKRRLFLINFILMEMDILKLKHE